MHPGYPAQLPKPEGLLPWSLINTLCFPNPSPFCPLETRTERGGHLASSSVSPKPWRAFQECLLGSLEVDLRPVLSQFFLFGGGELRKKNWKSKEETKSLLDSYWNTANCHLPTKSGTGEPALARVLQICKQSPEIHPNHVNSLSSTSTELRILKLIQGVLQAQQTQL